MTLSIATATSRRIVYILSALALTAALPQTSQAMTAPSSGLWKVDIAKSKFSSGVSTVVVERSPARDGTVSTFLVISRGKAYLARPAVSASGGIKAVDYGAWRGMDLVQIGTNVRAVDDCFFRCQYGFHSDRMIVTFRTTEAGRQPIADMLALASK